MPISTEYAGDVSTTLHAFSMNAALESMERAGSQLCFAPMEGGLLRCAHGELIVHLHNARQREEQTCTNDAEQALRLAVRGAMISMANGSSGGRDVDDRIRKADAVLETGEDEMPCIVAFPISWRREVLGNAKVHRALITRTQLDRALTDGRGDERKAVKTIIEARYEGRIHRMAFEHCEEGRIPGVIREKVLQHDAFYAHVMSLPAPHMPRYDRDVVEMLRARATRRLASLLSHDGMTNQMAMLQS